MPASRTAETRRRHGSGARLSKIEDGTGEDRTTAPRSITHPAVSGR